RTLLPVDAAAAEWSALQCARRRRVTSSRERVIAFLIAEVGTSRREDRPTSSNGARISRCCDRNASLHASTSGRELSHDTPSGVDRLWNRTWVSCRSFNDGRFTIAWRTTRGNCIGCE